MKIRKSRKKIRKIENRTEIKNLNLKEVSDVKYELHFKIMMLKIEAWIFNEFYNADNMFNLNIYLTKIHNYLKD
jgi:signal recognition particle subunit SEC65